MANIESALLLSAATNNLITTADFKTHVHEDLSDASNDTLIDSMIVGATNWAESFTGRRFMPGNCTYYIDGFPEDLIVLPRPIIQSITSVNYQDVNGTASTLTLNTDYIYEGLTGHMRPAYGKSWPSHRTVEGSVYVVYESGYLSSAGGGETASTQRAAVPAEIRLAVTMLAAHWYEFRIMGDVPNGVKMLLYPYRMKEFI